MNQPCLFPDFGVTSRTKGTVFPKSEKDERGFEYVLIEGQRLWTSHGIMHSQDTVQVHVDSAGTIYVMPTWEVRRVLRTRECRSHTVRGRVAGVEGTTGFGYIVPQYLVVCCKKIFSREPLPPQSSDTVYLGAAAERLAAQYRLVVDRACCEVLGLCASRYENFEAPSFSSVVGSNAPDGVARSYQEVKTDYKAEDTGNFYFEYAERNPKKLHTPHRSVL